MQSIKDKKFKRGFKAIGVALGAAFMSFALAFSACAVPMDSSGDKTANNKSLAAGVATQAEADATDTNSLRYVASSDFAKAWNNAVSVSKTKNKQVYFVLENDWVAPTSGNHNFGEGDGFSNGRITVPGGANIVLDLRGHTINRGLTSNTTYGSVIFVNGGSLTIEDSEGGGTITGAYTTNTSVDDYDYAAIMSKGGSLTLNGGNITGNNSEMGGGLYIDGGKFVMNGGAVTDNSSKLVGGGIYIVNGTAHEINGGVISGNKVLGENKDGTVDTTSGTISGGGVCLEKATLTMNGGKIHDNQATKYGGGVAVFGGSKFIFKGGEITANRAEGAAAIYANSSNNTIELNGGIITGNRVTTQSGAISYGAATKINIGGPVKIYDNYNASNDQANLEVNSSGSELNITSKLTKNGLSAFIGLTYNNTFTDTVTTGYGKYGNSADHNNNYIDADVFFFPDDVQNRQTFGTGTPEEIRLWYNSTGTDASRSRYYDVTWEYSYDGTTYKKIDGANAEITYDGREIKYVRATTESGATYTWSTSSSTMQLATYGSDSITSIKDAGTYVFRLNPYSKDIYSDDFRPGASNIGYAFHWNVSITVVPKEIKVNIAAKSSQYGCPIESSVATVNTKTPLVGGDTITSLVNLTPDASSSSDLGNYNIKGSARSTKNYTFNFKTATYTIEATTITATISGSGEYTGTAQDVTVTFNYPVGFASTAIKLTSSDYTVTYANDLINVGTYDTDDVTISLGNTTNASRFKLATTNAVTGSYEITKKALTISAKNISIGYGESEPVSQYAVTYNGLVDGEDASVLGGTLSYTCTDASGNPYTSSSPAGTYTITPGGLTSDNYDITFKTGKLSVGAAEVMKPSFEKTELTYTGGKLVFKLNDYSSNVNVEISDTTGNFVKDLDNDAINATNAGTCTVTFTLANNNYEWEGGGTQGYSVTLTVNKVEIAKPSFDKTEQTYTGDALPFNLIGFDDSMEVTLSDSTNFTKDLEHNLISGTNAGDCTVTFKIDTNNYKWEDGTTGNSYSVTLTINKATLVKPSFDETELTYTGGALAFRLTNYSANVDVTLSDSTNFTKDLDNNAINGSNVGECTVTFKIGNANYTWEGGGSASYTAVIKVSKATLVKPSFERLEQTYNGNLLAFRLNNYSSDVGLTLSNSGFAKDPDDDRITATNAGECIVTFSIANTNYEWEGGGTASYTATIKVLKASLVKPSFAKTAQPYTGETLAFKLLDYTEDVEVTIPASATGFTADLGNSAINGTVVGECVVTFKIANTNYEWEEGGTGNYTITIKVTNAALAKPSFDKLEQTYTGGVLSFRLTDYSDDVVLALSNSDFAKDPDDDRITATNAGECTVTFSIGNANFTWEDGDTKSFTLTITVKKATLTKPSFEKTEQIYTGGTLAFKISNYSANVEVTIPASATGFSTDLANSAINGTVVGECVVTFKIANTNYEWEGGGSASYTATINVKKATVTKPSFESDELTYNGGTVAFKLNGYSTVMAVTISDTTNFATDLEHNAINGTIVGECTVTFKIDTDNYEWDGVTGANYELKIKVNPMALKFSWTAKDSEGATKTGYSWDLDTDGTLEYVLTTAVPEADKNLIAFSLRYYNNSGVNRSVDGKVINMNGIDAGSYTAEVTLAQSGSSNYHEINANYIIDTTAGNTRTFSISAGVIDLENLGIVWSFIKDGDSSTEAALEGAELRYGLKDGVANVYAVTLPDISAAEYLGYDYDREGYTGGLKTVRVENGVETEVTDCTLPGTYRTYVALTSDENHKFENGTTSGEAYVEWNILKGIVDTSSIQLQYTVGANGQPQNFGAPNTTDYTKDGNAISVYEVDYAGKKITISVKNLPDGVKVNDDDISSKDSIVVSKTYITSVVTFTLTNTNFEQPEPVTFYWIITPKTITVESMTTGRLSYGGKTYKSPVANVDESLKENIDYVYTFEGKEYKFSEGGLAELYELADKRGEQISVSVKAVIKEGREGDYRITGKTETASFDIGDSRLRAEATLTVNNPTYSEVEITVTVVEKTENKTVDAAENYVLYIHKTDNIDSISSATQLGKIGEFDLKTLNVGKYVVEISMTLDGDDTYSLDTYTFLLEVVQKEIEVPQIVKSFMFGNETLYFKDLLDGKYQQYLDAGIIGEITGDASGVNAKGYSAALEIINANYKWKLPSADGKSVSKKAVVADEELSSYIRLDGDDSRAVYTWSIAPYKLGTDIINTSGTKGATINLTKLPLWARTMIAEGTLTVGVAYFSDEAGITQLLPEDVVIKTGRSYYVGAVIAGGENGDESGNLTFANDGSSKSTSSIVTYTVKESGASALMGNVKKFMSKSLLGLPAWVWIVIAVAVLILLIVIIVVARKSAKNKAKRAEEKALKEEEKRLKEEERLRKEEEERQRKEEEKQRREEERRMQQEKIEAERELARAKQEAELEKIRAQAQAAAGAGMASMAVQQPQQQMPQQPMMQQMPQMQMPMQQPMMQQMPMQQPAQQSGGMDAVMIALLQSQATLQAQITEMRATQDASAKAEMEVLKMQMLTGNLPQPQSNGARVNNGQGISAELLGEAIVTAFTKLAAKNEKPAELPSPEPETAASSAVYPPDAVVTTTTTVDTTQKNVRRERNDNSFADVDGFYDAID